MTNDKEIEYEMTAVTKGGETYRQKLVLPIDYPPMRWILDRIEYESGLINVSDGEFVNADCIAKLSFHETQDSTAHGRDTDDADQI